MTLPGALQRLRCRLDRGTGSPNAVRPPRARGNVCNNDRVWTAALGFAWGIRSSIDQHAPRHRLSSKIVVQRRNVALFP
jgi:hypothetical protein